ncbi:LCP family protein [Allorhizocola rhizosphaerae]|uniref:LCP family protein n=1 Tax=Allorhizocola rhizosphaerae TaxID=1872709 RepID=UPI001FEB004D|nr:LCP family protein [Allorhizocola rhizosphaerae]
MTYGSTAKRRARPRWGRIALVAVLALALCGGIGGLGAYLYAKGVDGGLERTDPFSSLTNGRPVEKVTGVQNILLVGTDHADPDSQADDPANARTDTIILMHIPSTQDRAYLVSIPRDLWVPVPQKATDKECGSRRAKINASYAWGDLPLLVRTVECFTDVRIHHVVQIDFGGFKQVVDALGGVDMEIEKDITSIHAPHRKFTKGTMHLNGAEALDYVRQRYQFPDGDFARMRHQQLLLKTLLDKAASGETLSNPVKFNAFVQAMSKAVKVDREFKLIDMAIQFRGIRSKDLTFLTSPTSGTDTIGGQSVVVSDRTKAIALYNAIVSDKMGEWASTNITPTPSANPR